MVQMVEKRKAAIEKALPHNIEAEQGLLGALLIDPSVYVLVADIVRVNDFYKEAHRLIYGAIEKLTHRNILADTITVGDYLIRQEQIEDAGGENYLDLLANREATSGRAEHYAAIVARTAKHRALIHAAGRIAALGYGEDEDALSQAFDLLQTLQAGGTQQQFQRMPDLMGQYMKRLDTLRNTEGLSGITTGFTDLDRITDGLQRTDLILLCARPSMGKTALALNMAYWAAKAGLKVAIYSLEMAALSLVQRLVAYATLIDSQRLRRGRVEQHEWDRIAHQAQALAGLPIFVNDVPGNPLRSIEAQLQRLIREEGQIDLVVIDYVGLIGSEGYSENRNLELGKISAGLKNLARKYNVPVLLLCQLSRKVEERQNKTPQLSDLRESGNLEQDADVVLTLTRPVYYLRQAGQSDMEIGPEMLSRADVGVLKQRNGPTGEIALHYEASITGFSNIEKILEG